MKLIEQLKKANIIALKNKEKEARAILSVVINKITTKEKEHNTQLNEEEVLQIILKVNKELEEEKAGYLKINNLERTLNIDKQIATIAIYIPRQLSPEDIVKEIANLDDKSLPNVIKHFKMNFAGRVDLGIVSKIARQ